MKTPLWKITLIYILFNVVSTYNAFAQTPLVLSGKLIYETNTYINASSLSIKDSTQIFVKHGVSLTIVADTFNIGTGVWFNAKGDSGASATHNPEWFGHHAQWVYEKKSAIENGCNQSAKCKQVSVGKDGGKGGTIKLIVRVMSMANNAITLINANGGGYGQGLKAGTGRRLSCIEHDTDRWDCTNCNGTNNGAKGQDGTLILYFSGPKGGDLLSLIIGLASPQPGSISLLTDKDWNSKAVTERKAHQ